MSREQNKILFQQWGPRTERIGYAHDDFSSPKCIVETSRTPITEYENPMLWEYNKSISFSIKTRCYEKEVYADQVQLCAEQELMRMIVKPFMDKAYEVRRAIHSRDFMESAHAIDDLLALMTKGQMFINDKTESL
jgi:hypothetical protein